MMHDFFVALFGEGKDINTFHTVTRSIAMFFVALVLLRIGGLRILGKKSAFDEVIAIMLGAILSRGIVGASSFGSVTAAGAAMVILHRLVAWVSSKSKIVANASMGEPIILYKNGQFDENHLSKCCLSREEVMESLRLQTNDDKLNKIDLAYLECNGRISFVKKTDQSAIE
jgi:uncharacterized membrane protein YcaP (DUF421 family)